MKITDIIYNNSPALIQSLLITIYSFLHHKKRYSEKYKYWINYFKEHEFSPEKILLGIQEQRLRMFLSHAYSNSEYYKSKLSEIDIKDISVKDMSLLPTLTKEELRNNIDKIVTVDKSDSYISRTGGTTGKPLTVFFEWDDFQERIALLDHFRNRFLSGDIHKYAWFSGKNILGNNTSNYWRTDYISKIRYYSTFHINGNTIKSYIKNFNKYRPSVFVGFPSSMVEIAKYGLLNSITLDYTPEAIFPTAETIIEDEIIILKEFFGCGVYDQYASSEGAPFITECEDGQLHFEVLSGVIEVIDENGKPSNTGELVVTAFATSGTPLIRYKIGDSITLKQGICSCGRETPLVKDIHGRINDYIYSVERGKINLGNISNCVKYTNGIIKFQILQDDIARIEVKLVVDSNQYTKKDEKLFVQELRARLGKKIIITINYVDDINKETSGKFRIVKNTLDLSGR